VKNEATGTTALLAHGRGTVLPAAASRKRPDLRGRPDTRASASRISFALIALQMSLQFAGRNIGQLTDIGSMIPGRDAIPASMAAITRF
jgi:hypothetical protein